MSRVRADKLTNRAGTGAPELTYGATVPDSYQITGAGDINLSGNAQFTGVTTISNLKSLTVAQDALVSGALTVTGNMTVQGTQTIINTEILDVEDKTIGIGSTSSPSNTTADGAGIVVYGSTDGSNDKTILWQNDTGCFEPNQPLKFKGVVETVAAATTYMSGSNLVVELDLQAATTYTYGCANHGNVGIISFKNMPADTGVQNGTTATIIFTQTATTAGGIGNTLPGSGIGVTCTVVGFENGSAVAGISTRGFQQGGTGSASTVTLSTGGGDQDFVSFFVHYNGGTNTTNTSYKVYVTKTGGYTQGTVGI